MKISENYLTESQFNEFFESFFLDENCIDWEKAKLIYCFPEKLKMEKKMENQPFNTKKQEFVPSKSITINLYKIDTENPFMEIIIKRMSGYSKTVIDFNEFRRVFDYHGFQLKIEKKNEKNKN